MAKLDVDRSRTVAKQAESKPVLKAMQAQKLRQSYQYMAGNVLRGQVIGQGRACLQHVFEHHLYSMLMGIIIVANAFFVIHETDLKASDSEIPTWITSASYIFLAMYTLEILLRLYVYRMTFFRSGWNIIDLLVVLTDLCAELTKIWVTSEAPSVSVLRIFRLARLLRVLAMLSSTNELDTMLLGFGSAMRAMIWACFMIGVVITVCSIVAVEFVHPLNVEVAKTGVYGDCRRCARAFETVAESNLTFIAQIIAGDSWGQITIPIIEAYPASGAFFLFVFGLIDLGVLNLILTVIVNAAESARVANHEMQLRGKARQIEEMKNKLKTLCSNLDDNDDGRISLEEFLSGLDENEEFARTLALLDIHKQDAEVVYRLMDEDGSGDVDFNEFIHTMISTKHETEKTQLLFLKAGMNEMQRDLRNQHGILNDMLLDVAGRVMDRTDVASAVERAFDESSAKVGLHADSIMAEFDCLTRKLDYRWEQLQREQAKNFRALENVWAEASLPAQPPVQRGIVRESPLASLVMPPRCTPCEIGYIKQSCIDVKQSCIIAGYPVKNPETSDPERTVEHGERTRDVADNN
mmetsp:Transcript_43081/g.80145  ORF Transcript_43081/g.80145 Transcript_43081/m.80145 type:complete len:579 (+) Transcript_43081:49-1785(+)